MLRCSCLREIKGKKERKKKTKERKKERKNERKRKETDTGEYVENFATLLFFFFLFACNVKKCSHLGIKYEYFKNKLETKML